MKNMDKKYSDIIGVNPNFDDTFNVIQERPNSWKSFITNSQFENNLGKIIHAFTASTSTDLNNRKSIWIQGTYGTGKSHSTSVIKHLLCDDILEIDDFLKSISNTQLRSEIISFRNNKRAFPVVLRGRYTIVNVKDLCYVIQEATRDALKKANISLNIKTDYETALNLLENKSYDSWWNSLLEDELKIYCQNKEDIKIKLKNFDREILGIIDEKFKNDTGSSFGTSSIIKWLIDVKNNLKEQGIADYLLIIWDEFTSLLGGSECRAILNTVQDIAELSKALDDNGEPEGIYIFIVTHKNIEQTDAYRTIDIEEQKLALARFITCSYEMQPNTIYHILSSSLDRKNEDEIKQLINERIINNVGVMTIIDKICDNTAGNRNEIKDKIISLYPIHPYTAYLSTFLSRQIGDAERSVFNYLNDNTVGFKKFINQKIDNEKFLSPSSIWDFFIKIYQTTVSSGKINEIISKYNMHLTTVQKESKMHLDIFKTVLLLNTLNSVVNSDEIINERSLVVPNQTNIKNCFTGIYKEMDVIACLSYLDTHNIVIKSPDELYEVSTSSISQEELSNTIRNNTDYFNDLTKAIEYFPLTTSPIENIIIQNQGKMVRKVQIIWLSSILKDNQIEINLSKYLDNNSSMKVAIFVSHGPLNKKTSVCERSQYELEQSLLKLSSKREEFKDFVFINLRTELGDINFTRFVESYSRAEVISKTKETEGSQEKKKSVQYITKWLNSIATDGVAYAVFRGTSYNGAIKQIANYISEKFTGFVYPDGLDTLIAARKSPIWEEKKAPKVIENILYSDNREDIESKFMGGFQTNLKCLLKDEKENYIFDTNMNLINGVSDNHPIVKLVKKVNTELSISKLNPIVDLTDKLKFIFQKPFGYSCNPISYAAVSLALKPYINKFFIASRGTKVDKTNMKEIIELLFQYFSTGRQSDKLKIRFSSQEEIDLIELLNNLFKINETGLINIKWKIRENFTKKCDAPLWTIKYLQGITNSKLLDSIDELFKFTIDTDENITQGKIDSLFTNLTNIKIEFGTNLEKAYQINLMKNYINIILQKDFHIEEDISDLEYKNYISYINNHIQREIPYRTENDIYNLVLRAHYDNQNEKENVLIHNKKDEYDIQIIEPVNLEKINNQETKLLEKLELMSKSPDDLISLILKIYEKYPMIIDEIIEE